MKDLIVKLKKQIVAELYLEDIAPDEIDTDLPLFGDGLGLDSIDALSLVVLLEKEYGVQVVDPEEGKAILYSIQTIANHIQAQTGKP
ncbi:acyl carrier protein [bacterium]|nr:acyl carrier protein [bacterium]